jgi:transcriptional regulator with XRE-family HTH domain
MLAPRVRYNIRILSLERMKVPKHRGQKASNLEPSPGQRVAQLRKERGLTQQEMAARLGVSQPVVSDYECGALRLHGELIAKLTEILAVSADELLGLTPLTDRSGALKNRKLHRRLQQLDRLPPRDQQALLRTIDAFLAKAS